LGRLRRFDPPCSNHGEQSAGNNDDATDEHVNWLGELQPTRAIGHIDSREEAEMAKTDKVKNAKQKAKGKLKEVVGEASGDDSLKLEGKSDQRKASLKQAGEKVKDALKKWSSDASVNAVGAESVKWSFS
jgi:uncharacterized protein YjbJ (UPF0337 family)